MALGPSMPEPELLDVGRAHVVTDGVDDGIGPRPDGEGGDRDRWVGPARGPPRRSQLGNRGNDLPCSFDVFRCDRQGVACGAWKGSSRRVAGWPRRAPCRGADGCRDQHRQRRRRLPGPDRASGRRTRPPRRRRTSSTTWRTRRVRERRLAAAERGAPRPSVEPNAGHRALVDLERSGRLLALAHPERGRPPPRGRLGSVARWSRCTARSASSPASAAATAARSTWRRRACGPARPTRRVAGAAGSSSRRPSASARASCPTDLARAGQAARSCDLLLAVGTHPRRLPDRRRGPARGGRTAPAW